MSWPLSYKYQASHTCSRYLDISGNPPPFSAQVLLRSSRIIFLGNSGMDPPSSHSRQQSQHVNHWVRVPSVNTNLTKQLTLDWGITAEHPQSTSMSMEYLLEEHSSQTCIRATLPLTIPSVIVQVDQ